MRRPRSPRAGWTRSPLRWTTPVGGGAGRRICNTHKLRRSQLAGSAPRGADRQLLSPRRAADAKKPEDWDDEEDGDWEAPRIINPKCEKAPGCGEWKRPTKRVSGAAVQCSAHAARLACKPASQLLRLSVLPRSPCGVARHRPAPHAAAHAAHAPLCPAQNPAYKGKWSAPLIDNPAYKGVWKPRDIPNPDYFKDDVPLSNIGKGGCTGRLCVLSCRAPRCCVCRCCRPAQAGEVRQACTDQHQPRAVGLR